MKRWPVLILALAGLAPDALAQIPVGSALTYQGELRTSGQPAAGPVDLRFTVFDAAAAGTQIAPPIERLNVALAQGRFTQELDFGPVFGADARFLEIEVRSPPGAGAYIVLTPRQRVTPAAVSQFSLQALGATNATQLNGQAPSFYQNASNITAGTLPGARLGGAYANALTLGNLTNQISGVFTGNGAGISGINASSLSVGTLSDARLSANVALLNNPQTFTGAKVFSAAPAFNAPGAPFSVSATGLVANLNADRLDGLDSAAFLQSIPVPLALTGASALPVIRGENASTAGLSAGVSGISTGANGTTYGVHGRNDSTSGAGVFGTATAATGATYGGRFESDSTSGRGVYAVADAATGTTYGVHARNDSAEGIGVYGQATSAAGESYGGWFVTAGTGAGVYGRSTANNTVGVEGEALGNFSWGVVGRSNHIGGFFETTGPHIGVWGYSTAAGTTQGVRGTVSSTSGVGVLGDANAATGLTYGGRFEAASDGGRGVLGYATAATGSTIGVRGRSDSPAGVGVFGEAEATSGSAYGGWFESASSAGVGAFGNSTALTGLTSGLRGEAQSTSGRGVVGYATAISGATNGVRGRSDSPDGTGVFGEAEATSGSAYGGWFESASSAGVGAFGNSTASTGLTSGLRGEAQSTGGRGVVGYATATSGATNGVRGRSDSPDGAGVFGEAEATSGSAYGGWFETASGGGSGVLGWAKPTTGINYGGAFQTDSSSGRGVMGLALSASGTTTAGRFESASPSSTAVYGLAYAQTGFARAGYFESRAEDGFGVYARVTGDGSADAVFAVHDSITGSGYAVLASGDTAATGNKSFRIDHPDDPENKYLLHYCAESPEVINFYSGKTTLDGAGEAVIELPHYFARINRDPRYTLTAVGSPMPLLHVAEEIDEGALSTGAIAGPGDPAPLCRFRIAGGAPGGKVSWRVEAIRNDRWAQRRGAPVEIDKPAVEKGTYQHPELYDQPAEKSMHYDPDHRSRRATDRLRRPDGEPGMGASPRPVVGAILVPVAAPEGER